jgi:hypothetical protein
VTLASREQVETDAFDLVQEINTLQKHLADLLEEFKAANIAYRDGRYQTLVAQAKVSAIRADLDITKARMMGLQSMLKAIPR